MANSEWKEKMIRQLEMRMNERKQERRSFDDSRLADALINCVVYDCEWQTPVGLEDEMELWCDCADLEPDENGETRVEFDGYEAVMSGLTEAKLFRRQVLRLEDGSTVMVAYTSSGKNEQNMPAFAPVTAGTSCRKLLRELAEHDTIGELVLNPGTDDLFVTREQAEYLLHAAERQISPRPAVDFRLQCGVSTRMTMRPPIQKEAFANVETVLRSLRDMKYEFLTCILRRQEEYKGGYRADFVQAMYGSGNGRCRVEVSIVWEINRLTHRVLLYDELTTDETVAYFRELLTLGNIPERTKEFHVFYEEKTEEAEEE